MLVPLALAARLGAIAANFATAALDAGVARGDAPGARGSRGFGGLPAAVPRTWRSQGHGTLEGVEHGRLAHGW